jgi:hypothetical protein
MSERGLAKLLEIRHSALQSMATTGLPKTVKPFIDKDFIVATILVKEKEAVHITGATECAIASVINNESIID